LSKKKQPEDRPQLTIELPPPGWEPQKPVVKEEEKRGVEIIPLF
jgi:hypothetical protein